jgi:hypothetical protein
MNDDVDNIYNEANEMWAGMDAYNIPGGIERMHYLRVHWGAQLVFASLQYNG